MMGELLFPSVRPFTSVSDKWSWKKNPAVAGNHFLWQTWRNSGCFGKQHHASSQVSRCKHIAITSGLVWTRAGMCSCTQTSAAGTLGGCFEVINAIGAQVQGVCLWYSCVAGEGVASSLVWQLSLLGLQNQIAKCLSSPKSCAVSHRVMWCLCPKASAWTCLRGQNQGSAWGFWRLQALRPFVQNWALCKEKTDELQI